MTTFEILSAIKDSWDNADTLEYLQLNIIQRQLEIAESMSAQETRLNAAFISEKEDSYKSTDAVARAKAKLLVKSNDVDFQLEFEILNNLLEITSERISRASRVLVIPQE